MAKHIVGREDNPVKQASLIYDWIDAYFPWAGAREYSTIPNLAEYALNRGYGDCGQVSLLYINLLRNIGIPARWESGWYLEPEDVGIHDWAEVYFEGVGWVPVDMSFGLNLASKDKDVVNFYKSGMDYFRLCGKPRRVWFVFSGKESLFEAKPWIPNWEKSSGTVETCSITEDGRRNFKLLK